MRQIQPGQGLLDQLLPELPLHERVRRDHPNEAGFASLSIPTREVEETLRERNPKGVLTVATSSRRPGTPGSAPCPSP